VDVVQVLEVAGNWQIVSKKNGIFLVGALSIVACLLWMFWTIRQPVVQEVALSTFFSDLKSGKVTEIAFRGRQYTYKRHTTSGIEEVQSTGIEPDQTFNDVLTARGVTFEYYRTDNDFQFLKSLVVLLPMIVAFSIFYVYMHRFNNSVMERFGKSKARRLSHLSAKVTFENVAGVDEARDELTEIIDFLKEPMRFQRLGGRIPKGVLLMGPPGTGKTLLARAIAGEADVPFFSVSGAEFMEMFIGVGASRVRDLFAQGMKEAPCVIFIDEIDAVGRQRGAGLSVGQNESEQTLNQLLVEMDGFKSNDGVIVVAATNRPDILDPALLRPGRFDRVITVPGPDVRGRQAILSIYTKRTPMDSEVSLSVIARSTPGFSGADLENMVNEAALLAARKGKDLVEKADFEEAIDKVLMGVERRSMIIGDSEKRTIAFHEAGHALTARLISGTDPVHKVTIIPRGQTLGLTQQIPLDDTLLISKRFIQAKIAVLMGGRVAEEIFINDLSSGADRDIKSATSLARQMVSEWGMSKRLGPLHYGRKGRAISLGRRNARCQDFSAKTEEIIDEEVQKIVMTEYRRARVLVESNLAALTGLAEKLLEMEVLDGVEVDSILREQGAKGEVSSV
jgi:cell division protease FtsH